MITIEPLEHRGKKCIALRFDPRRVEIKQKLKRISTLRYTRTHGCWYIPYEEQSYVAFQKLKLPYQVKSKETSGQAKAVEQNTPIAAQTSSVQAESRSEFAEAEPSAIHSKDGKIRLHLYKQRFYISMDFSKSRVRLIKKLQGVYWDDKYKLWVCSANLENLKKLQNQFEFFDESSYSQWQKIVVGLSKEKKLRLYPLPHHKQRIGLQLIGPSVDYHWIKQISDRSYDKANRQWLIPKDKKLLQRILAYFEGQNYKIENRLAINPETYSKEVKAQEKAKNYLEKTDPAYKSLVKLVLDKMIQMRYSWSSMRLYIPELIQFCRWMQTTEIEAVSQQQVNDYLVNLAKAGLSDSKLHNAVNAFLFYYRYVVGKSEFYLEQIKRPKKTFRLPKVLSQKEVQCVFEAASNDKHRLVLRMIYACGLRLSELISLKLNDVDYERAQVFVQNAKGRKDRIVMLSQQIKEELIAYCAKYRPAIYVFEGRQAGQPYSSRSVQSIVRKAKRKAGIQKRLTPHVLRHCFATHLHDQGVSIKHIQELLGHKNVETTMIYTHVSQQSLRDIVSPLDRLLE